MKKTLWTKNFTLVTAASVLGAMGEALDYRLCITLAAVYYFGIRYAFDRL